MIDHVNILYFTLDITWYGRSGIIIKPWLYKILINIVGMHYGNTTHDNGSELMANATRVES